MQSISARMEMEPSNLKFENNWIQSCNGVTVGMGGNKKLVRAAISLHSQSKQYVKLRIAANKVYSSKVGLDNNVKGLNIQKSNAVTLKKGLLTTKNSDR